MAYDLGFPEPTPEEMAAFKEQIRPQVRKMALDDARAAFRGLLWLAAQVALVVALLNAGNDALAVLGAVLAIPVAANLIFRLAISQYGKPSIIEMLRDIIMLPIMLKRYPK